MKKLVAIAVCVLPIVVLACTTETVQAPPAAPPAETPPTNQPPATVTGTVGAEGGVVEADGVTLTVPAGALAEETSIVITKTADSVPARHTGVSALYKFEPDGLKFKKPATLTFHKVPADTAEPTVGLAKKDGADGVFEGQVTKAAGEDASASISKLATAFLAARDCKAAENDVKAVCKAVPAPAALKSGTINGFAMTGFEYWQWKKPDPYAGGDEVAWGYNGDGQPETGVMPTDQSRACMAESFKALEAILKDPPAELKPLAAKNVKQFWFWNNDMTDAKTTVKVPKGNSELWLYAPEREDGGLIKWISSTERDGVCHLPTRADLITFAKACSAKPANAECGSGK
jgi:hypothetical protein